MDYLYHFTIAAELAIMQAEHDLRGNRTLLF